MILNLGMTDAADFRGDRLDVSWRRIVTDYGHLLCLVTPQWIRLLPLCGRDQQRYPKALTVINDHGCLGAASTKDARDLLRETAWPPSAVSPADVTIVVAREDPRLRQVRPVPIPLTWRLQRAPVAAPSINDSGFGRALLHAETEGSGILYLFDLGSSTTAAEDDAIVFVPESWLRVADGFTGGPLELQTPSPIL